MSTREELQSNIAVLNKEIAEVIDANRLSAAQHPVAFPIYSWVWTVLVSVFLASVMLFPQFNGYLQEKFSRLPWMTLYVYSKIIDYLPLLGLVFGWYATFWTMRWIFYRTVSVRLVKAGQEVVYNLEAQRRLLLDELRRMGDSDEV